MNLYTFDRAAGAKANKVLGFERLVHPHPNGKEWLCSAPTYQALCKKGFKEAQLSPPEEAGWSEASSRLILAVAAMVGDPMPDEVRDEIQLHLYCRPSVRVEYMGRGRLSDRHLPGEKEDLITLDIADRGREYLFRVVRGETGRDERLQRMLGHWAEWSTFINDPGSKIVLSFGGGGFRLFGATTVLKALDRLLDDRSQVSEVWGSSGGALLGYVYAMGFDATTLESLGYDLYHARNPDLTDGSLTSVALSRLKGLMNSLRGKTTRSDMALWLDELEKKQPPDRRRPTRLPFFALATNTARGGLTALGSKDHIPASCQDIILPCDPRDAVAASTAVPLLLRAQQGITGLDDDDTWVDGSIVDENPLTLPYIKWLRERAEAPDKTPDRLKIVMVSLNLRSTEVPLLAAIDKAPLLGRVKTLKRLVRLVDLALDSKTDAVIRTMTESPNVEVYTLKLNLGRLHLNDPGDIPAAIRAGRTIESWQLTTYRKFV
jgi:predicted acylesterase/phospholipase RssA